MYRKIGKKWVVFNKSGTKRLGSHPSEAAALAQLRAIEISKHRRKGK